MDADTPLPERPRLRASVDVVPLAEDRVLVRGHRGTVALSGAFVAEALPALLGRLDGECTLAALFDLAGEAFRVDTEDFLRMMQARGYICAGSESDDTGPAHAAYWSLNAPDSAARLAAAHVLIAGGGRVAAALKDALAEAGVGRCTALPCDALLDDPPDAWQAAAAAATVIVLASDGMSLAGIDRLNAFGMERGVPWLLIRIDRARALVGPYVIPGETACFACYELRARNNAEHPGDHEALYRHWRHVGDRPADAATPPGTGRIVGGWAALDLARTIASGRKPVTAGRIVELELHTLQSTTHEILRLPRCPACSRLRSRPLTRIWDILPKRVAN